MAKVLPAADEAISRDGHHHPGGRMVQPEVDLTWDLLSDPALGIFELGWQREGHRGRGIRRPGAASVR